MNSVSGRFSNGLANDNDMVGRNLMFHPYASVIGSFDRRLDGQFGPAGCCIWSQEFYETDRSRGFLRGYTMEIVRARRTGHRDQWLNSGQIPWSSRFS
ncbi:MAG: hypothetical protein R3E83_18990 [Burkholderiaceae bacterium]